MKKNILLAVLLTALFLAPFCAARGETAPAFTVDETIALRGRFIKYAVLIIFVIVLPLCVKLTPFFCKYICPSGTLAGILLAFSDTGLFRLFGSMFMWKACVLGIIVLASVLIYRPFCKYLCPLGALYALFNKIALVQMKTDETKCTSCKACFRACDMCVDPSVNPNSAECIRCGKCISACPENAIKYCFVSKKSKVISDK